jgi:uncharacterized phage protein gp47/JayE
MTDTTTSVPAVTFTATGLVVPSESAILAGVQQDINAAFGGNLNPALNTPQGQLATTQAACIANADATFAEFVNQVDPDTASGFMQDAIARIYFLTRQPGTPTAVVCTCTGLFGTVIPVGAQAQDTSGNIYVATQAGTIGVGGTVTLSFANVVDGPIACPTGALNSIYQAIPGWESVTNAAPGVAGSAVESRAAFEFRRINSVARNATGSLPAIYAAVFNVPGVIDVYVTQNNTAAAVNTGSTNYSVAAHSVYVAVVGGNSAAVALAIWENTNVGCAYNGNTSVTVADPSPYSIPIPTYSVLYETPTSTPILFAVQIAASSLLPVNITTLVQNAIIASFTGADGSQRARIGSLVLASKFYAPVSAIGPEVSILSILIGTSTATLNSVQMGIDQAPTVVAGNISVTYI